MGVKKLEPFQEEGVKFLSENVHALLADDMGLGKTIQTIRALEVIKASSVLIVCPASLRYTWLNALKEDGQLFLKYTILTGTAPQRDTISFEVLIASYEYVVGNAYFFQNIYFDVIVCDEAHYLRRLASKRTAAILGHFGVARHCIYKWMLTGTPIHNRPIDLFPVLSTLAVQKLGEYKTPDAFARRYCGGPLALGSTRQLELRERLKGFMLRRMKSEVMKNLPELTIETIFLDPSLIPAFQGILKKGDKIKESVKIDVYNMGVLGELATHRQELALAKIPLIMQYIEDMLEHQQKLVVFFFHKSVMRALMGYYQEKFPYAIYYGDLSPIEKERQKAHFVNNEEVRLFLGQVNAAGTGLDGLQYVCNTVLFAEWDWTPGGNSQATDRLHRMGQENPVLAQFLVVKGSWEEDMLDKTDRKKRNSNKILNN